MHVMIEISNQNIINWSVDTQRNIPVTFYIYLKDFGDGLMRPSVLETDSPLYKGYKSVMVYAKIQKKELADEVFTLNYLPRVDDLR